MSHALPREWFGSSIRNDGLRREEARLKARTILAYVAGALYLLLVILFYFWQGVQVIRLGYDIDALQGEYQRVSTERDRLEVELASMKNLQLVEQVALEELGMVYPTREQVVVVIEEGEEGREGSPQ